MFECVDNTVSTDVVIEGLALTDPRFSKYPMLLSLLKFHSPSTVNKDNTSSSVAAATANTAGLGNKDNETEV